MAIYGMRCGRYAGHRTGQYFLDGAEVWRCTKANKKTDSETSELVAVFATKKDAHEWAAMKTGAK